MTVTWPSRQHAADVRHPRARRGACSATSSTSRRRSCAASSTSSRATAASGPAPTDVTMVPKRKQIREALTQLELWVDPTTLAAGGDAHDVRQRRHQDDDLRATSSPNAALDRRRVQRWSADELRRQPPPSRERRRRGRQVVFAAGSASGSIIRCVRRSARSRNSAFRGSTSRSHCHSALAARAGSAPTAATSRNTARRSARRRAPAPTAGGACRSAPSGARAAARPHLLEVGGAGQRRQDREARLEQLVALDERPQPLEVGLAPRRIDHEVAGDAVAEARARRRCPRPSDRRSRPSSGPSSPSLVAASSPKKMSKSPRDRPPRLEQLRVAAPRGRRGSARGSTACGCRGGAAPAPARGCATGDARTDRRRRRRDRRPTRSRGRPSRSIARAPCARAAARSSRTSSGTDSRAPSRRATSADAPGRRTAAASGRRDGAPAAARRRARSVAASRRPSAAASPSAIRQRQAGHRRRAGGRVRARRTCAAAPARRRRARRRRRPATRNGSGYAAAVWPPMTIGTSGASARARCRRAPARRRSRARASRRCRRGRAAACACSDSSERLKRRSASVTRWPRASSAAAMYSMPSGSMRKNGPRPKRSLPGTGRSSRMCIAAAGSVTMTLGGCSAPAYSPRSSRSVSAAASGAAPTPSCVGCGRCSCSSSLSAVGMRGCRFDADVLSLLPHIGRVVPAFRTFLDALRQPRPALRRLHRARRPQHRRIRRTRSTRGSTALRSAPEISARRHRTSSTSRATGPGSPIASCCCSRTQRCDERARPLRPGRHATRPSPTPRELLTRAVAGGRRAGPPAIRSGLLDLLRTQLGGTQAGRRPSASSHGGYVTADGRRRLRHRASRARPPYDTEFSRALDRVCSDSRRHRCAGAAGDPATPTSDAAAAATSSSPAAIASRVETEAVVRRESIVNSVGSLALILPLLYLVFRSLWLVVVGSAAVGAVAARRARRARVRRRARCRRRPPARRRCCSASASTASCCSTSPIASHRDAAPSRRTRSAARGPGVEHAARHVDDGGDVLRLDVRRLPEPQQLGLLIGHSMVVCGILTLVLVPALLPRRASGAPAARPHDAAARGVGRRGTGGRPRRRASVADRRAGASRPRGCASTRRSIGCARSPPARACSRQIGPTFGLPERRLRRARAAARDLEALLAANERLATAASRDALPALAVAGADALLPSRRAGANGSA